MGDGEIRVNGKSIRVLSERDPANLPWGEMGVQVAIESTGIFTKRPDAEKTLESGRQKSHHLGPGDR